jgi:hypothetical protein
MGFPCAPEDVVYRYSVWGQKESSTVPTDPRIGARSDLAGSSIDVIGIQQIDDVLTIDYRLERASASTVRVVDLMGSIVLEVDRKTWSEAGREQATIDVATLPAGTYFVQIVSKAGGTGGRLFNIMR